jgi:hypothetical protein
VNEYAGFPDLPVLGELGDRLGAAFAEAERTRPAPRVAWRWRPLLVGAILFVLLAASAAAATLLALRGAVIPAPEHIDLQPPMIVKPDTVRLSGVTAADPVDRRTWTVRLARSETGLTCLTAGELRGDRFGITGLDHRFRTLAPGFTDGCGATYVGARVFDSTERRAVRTVVDGYAPGLQRVTLESTTGRRDLKVSKEGAFVGILAGYPEDIGIRVKLVFGGGKTRTHTFGRSPLVTPDPGGATRIESFVVSNRPHTGCVQVVSAREVRPFATAPSICGPMNRPYFFKAVTLREGAHGGAGVTTWHWRHPSRTVVYGSANRRRVKRITLVGAGRALRIKPIVNGAFQLLLPASVDPSGLVLVVTLQNGSVERARTQANLVAPARGRFG